VFIKFGTIDQNKWDSLGGGAITITFYAQDNAGNIGSTSVLVNKRIPSDPAIYGFDLIIIFCVVFLTGIILIQRTKRMKRV